MLYKLIVLVFFSISYLGIISFSRKKTWFAAFGAVIIVISTALFDNSSQQGIFKFVVKSINWNVLGIFLGTLLIAEAFIESKVPALIAHYLVSKSKNAGTAILLICIMASFLSAFVENVATVLIIAPIALAISERQKISPVPFLIGIAISSNLQGTATLVGDPPSMILAGYMRMNFNQFFFLKGKPGIFFAVQVGAVISFLILYLFFMKYKTPVISAQKEKVISWFPTILILLMIVLLAFSSLIDPEFSYLGGVLCMALGVLAGMWFIWGQKCSKRELFKKIDFDTLIFLSSIFILVGSLIRAGIMDDMATLVLNYLGEDIFLIYTFMVWFSVVVSAFVDNVPYVTAMIPVATIISTRLGISPYLLVFGLLIGACLGGNITPVGASANIVSVSILKRRGHHVSIWEFMKIGLPFTLGATFSAYIFLWLIWR